jgi:hypothetical protein
LASIGTLYTVIANQGELISVRVQHLNARVGADLEVAQGIEGHAVAIPHHFELPEFALILYELRNRNSKLRLWRA